MRNTLLLTALFTVFCFSALCQRQDTVCLDSTITEITITDIIPETISADSATLFPSENLNGITPKNFTIQICTKDYKAKDHFLDGNNKIKIIQTGSLYRYIFSLYNSLEDARKELDTVRKIYPDAYIREYHEGKLGQAFDMKINNENI